MMSVIRTRRGQRRPVRLQTSGIYAAYTTEEKKENKKGPKARNNGKTRFNLRLSDYCLSKVTLNEGKVTLVTLPSESTSKMSSSIAADP